jgi:superfamily I DNA/RNA helicase
MDIEGCENIRAGTLHSFCFSLLMRDDVFGFLDRYPRGLVSFSQAGVARFEATPLLQDIRLMGNFGGPRDISHRILAFEAAWARLQHEQPGWAQDPVDQQFERCLEDWLGFHNAMMVGELVPLTLNYLRGNPTCEALEIFDHIIVDEYQDLNRGEQELLDVLSGNCCLSIVGDIDQSIYSFRHAHPEGIEDFSTRHVTHDETLNACRRCGSQIVDLANSVILRNHAAGASDRLLPMDPPERAGDVGIVQWLSLGDEAEGVADYVEHLLANGYSAGDILLLSPRRLIAKGIKEALLGKDIEAHSFYNDKLLEPDEAQLAFNKLTLLADREDRVALRFWLGLNSPSCRARQYAKLMAYCNENDTSPFDVLAACSSGDLAIAGVGQLVERYDEVIENMEHLEWLNVSELLDELFPEGEEWADAIRELMVEKLDDVTDAEGLHKVLHAEITQPEMPPDGEFVRLMSLHKSKGLTSRVVVLVGCMRGLMPFIDRNATGSRRAALLKEQRRLFYVALTRAKEKLVLSSVSSLDRSLAHKLGAIVGGGRGAGRTIACEFIQELGPNAPRTQRGDRWAANGYT